MNDYLSDDHIMGYETQVQYIPRNSCVRPNAFETAINVSDRLTHVDYCTPAHYTADVGIYR